MRAGVQLITVAILAASCGGTTAETGAEPTLDASAIDAAPPCEGDGWRVFEARELFRFRAPCSVTGGPEQGFDSFVGRYQDDGLEFSYDYGSYSSTLEEWSEHEDYSTEPAAFDGRSGSVVSAYDPSASNGLVYLAGIHVPDVDGQGSRLTMYGVARTTDKRDVLLAILATTNFP